MEWMAIRKYCCNCGKLVIGYRKKGGEAKLVCTNCGSTLIAKPVTRKHIRCDIHLDYRSKG